MNHATKTQRRALAWVAGALVLAAFYTLGVFWFPLLLSAWFAQLARPIAQRLSRAMGGRGRSASVITVLLVVAVLSPIAVALLSLTGDAVQLIEKIGQNSNGTEAFWSALLDSSNGAGAAAPNAGNAGGSPLPPGFPPELSRVFELVGAHGEGALGIAGRVLGVTASVFLALVVFVTSFYNNLTHGRSLDAWLRTHSPLSESATSRLIAAFQETGHGLLVAVGLTALVQGAIASVGYMVVGVPHGLVFGLLTAVAGLVPAVGTGLIWAPVALGLLLGGRSGAAIAILVLGLVVSSADNVLRPLLSKLGRLQLAPVVLFLSLLGGMVAFGPTGVLLGPLLVRMAFEALALLAEARLAPGEPLPSESVRAGSDLVDLGERAPSKEPPASERGSTEPPSTRRPPTERSSADRPSAEPPSTERPSGPWRPGT